MPEVCVGVCVCGRVRRCTWGLCVVDCVRGRAQPPQQCTHDRHARARVVYRIPWHGVRGIHLVKKCLRRRWWWCCGGIFPKSARAQVRAVRAWGVDALACGDRRPGRFLGIVSAIFTRERMLVIAGGGRWGSWLHPWACCVGRRGSNMGEGVATSILFDPRGSAKVRWQRWRRRRRGGERWWRWHRRAGKRPRVGRKRRPARWRRRLKKRRRLHRRRQPRRTC
mmetsp:Transcript_21567/g.66906  ORF Transcript_21567/g.66906 Transcript_21567/m.66906 type:complete len:223 (-) Transcript_21567:821-1489(-)